jgi:chemotaxis signal transduction protein
MAQGETRSFGFVVDQVCEIRAISSKEIEPTPDVCGDRVRTFVAGILKIDRQARVIIDAFSLCNREAQTELSLP